MRLRDGQRPRPSAVLFILEEGGVYFALPLQPHKETVREV